MSILIEKVRLDGVVTDVYMEGPIIKKIGPDLAFEADTVIDGSGMAILPSFNNAHTHAAMTLMRGYSDDQTLHDWLEKHIWPYESNLNEEFVYHGARLACLEMIKSGTTFFNDMYWFYHGTARAVEEMGLKANLSPTFIDHFDPNMAEKHKQETARLLEESRKYSDSIVFTLGPHAIYTVSEESLRWCAEYAAENDLMVHIHLSETEKEVSDCLKMHGMRPVKYLEKAGLLGPRLIAIHVVWVDDEERDLLGQYNVKIVHCPKSNMKLCSGKFGYSEFSGHDALIAIATDGCASNNNLDMREELKFASLYEKAAKGDPTLMSAGECFEMGTRVPSDMFDLNAGVIAEGRAADCILVDLSDPRLTPGYDLISDLVYSADSSCIDTTICNGRILMRHRKVEGEEEVVAQARRTGHQLAAMLK